MKKNTPISALMILLAASILVGCGSAPALDDKQGTTYNQTMPTNQKATLDARKQKADNLK